MLCKVYLIAFYIKRSLDFPFFFLFRKPSLANERIKFVCFQISNIDTIHKPRGTKIGIVVSKLHLENIPEFGGFQGEDIFLLSKEEYY